MYRADDGLQRGLYRRPFGKLKGAAQAFYERLPSATEMQALGLTPADYEGDEFEVWPENWPAFSLFHNMQTQWRTGAAGPTGLDYAVLFTWVDRLKITAEEFEQFISDIQVMEFSALEAMNKKD